VSLPAAIQTRISATAESAAVYKIREPTGSNKRYWSHKSYPVIRDLVHTSTALKTQIVPCSNVLVYYNRRQDTAVYAATRNPTIWGPKEYAATRNPTIWGPKEPKCVEVFV
jgi:hypothetical protein